MSVHVTFPTATPKSQGCICLFSDLRVILHCQGHSFVLDPGEVRATQHDRYFVLRYEQLVSPVASPISAACAIDAVDVLSRRSKAGNNMLQVGQNIGFDSICYVSVKHR
jgi:hypothetical protein